MSWISGYKIPFHTEPFQVNERINRSYTPTETHVIDNCILELLESGFISPCSPSDKQFVSSVFTVPKPNGKHRFILNLKELNKFIQVDHFKMEDYRTALKLLDTDYFMATLDLKDAYFLLPVAESDRIWLRFYWNSETFSNQLFQFNVLPFGLCTAPYVFTKLLKPVLYYLRSLGHLSVIYLDDFLCIGNTYIDCLDNVNITRKTLIKLGFIINNDKSQLNPAQQCTFLGFTLNTVNMTLTLPFEKKLRIKNNANELLITKKLTIREFARFLGLLTSACPAVKYGWVYTKLMEREKFLALNYSMDYNKRMHLPNHLKNDLLWWRDNIEQSFSSFQSNDYSITIYSDASTTGWGVVCNNQTANGHWSRSQLTLHINTLELLAALYGLKIFARNLINCNILLRIDNTTAIAYINKMGGIQFTHLNKIARELWQWCEKRNIYVFASYIKSSDNIADFESRQSNIDTEWELADYAYKQITTSFGIPQFDLFASSQNCKCARYASWKLDPHSEIIDAFTFNWKTLDFYAFPPFCLITKVLNKIKNDKAEGILVAPFWPAQPWYPLWSKLLVSDVIYFKPDKNLLVSPFRIEHPLHADLTLMAGKLSASRCSSAVYPRLRSTY